MKYLKKKRKKKSPVLIILICVLCVALAAAAWLLYDLQQNADDEKPSEAVSTEEAQSGTAEAATQNVTDDMATEATEATEDAIVPIADYNIETPYGTLIFSGEWGDQLDYNVIEGDYVTVQFAAVVQGEKIPIFDILFNSPNGERFGYLTTESGSQISVSAVIYDIVPSESWTETQSTMVYGMQDELNDIIARLNLAEEMDVAANFGDDITVNTRYTTLHYPEMWKGYVRTEVTDGESCVVSFYGTVEGKDEQHLFDIVIGGTGESYIGYLTAEDGSNLEVYMTSYEFSFDETWSEEEINLIYGMIEASNYIFEKLEAEGNLTF